MKLRWFLASVLAVLILAGCAPDGGGQGGAPSASGHPSGHEAPATDATPGGGRYDY